MGISLEKVQQQAPELVSLAKSAGVSLQKKGLGGEKARVALVLDFSGSMDPLYRNGTVQQVAERILALGTQFDDDGAIDVYFFGSDAWYAGELTLADYKGGINRLIKNKRMGSTNMAGAITEVVRKSFEPVKSGFLGRKTTEVDKSVPVYAAFITDGEPDSARAAEQALREASEHPVFFQTVGVASYPGQAFRFLQGLDDLDGRKVDNAGYMKVTNIGSMSDADLYDGMLNEFPSYLQAARQAGVLQ